MVDEDDIANESVIFMAFCVPIVLVALADFMVVLIRRVLVAVVVVVVGGEWYANLVLNLKETVFGEAKCEITESFDQGEFFGRAMFAVCG